MQKVVIAVLLLVLVVPLCEAQQGTFSPYDRALLDLYYLATNSQIDGSLIIDGTISTSKLDFAVVLYGQYAAFTNVFRDHTNVFNLHTNLFNAHTNDASAHHTRFENSEETDQIFTNYLATNTAIVEPAYATLHAGASPLVIATNLSVLNGTIAAGDISSTWVKDQIYLHVEESGVWDVRFGMTNLPGSPHAVLFTGYYAGSVPHNVKVRLWDFTNNGWTNVTTAVDDIPSGSTPNDYVFEVDELVLDDVISGSAATVSVLHVGSATASHDFYTDYIALLSAQFAIQTAEVYSAIGPLVASVSKDVTVDTNAGTLEVTLDGDYRLDVQASGTGDSNTTYTVRVEVDSNPTDIEFYRTIGTLGSIGNAGDFGLLRLTNGNVVRTAIAADNSNTFASVINFHFGIERLGL